MKLGALTPVFNEEKLVKGCIESLKPFVDRHIFCVSQESYFRGQQAKDNTSQVAKDLGAEVIEGFWSLDHHQRNTAIEKLQDCDWLICTDVDMWFEHETVERLIKHLETSDKSVHTAPQHAYWRDIDHVLVNDTFKPVVAIKPHVRFRHIGATDHPEHSLDDIWVHHINWCEPKDIFKKVMTYSHSNEFDGRYWYENHYLTWQEGQDAELPNRGRKTVTFNVKKQPLPEELRAYL